MSEENTNTPNIDIDDVERYLQQAEINVNNMENRILNFQNEVNNLSNYFNTVLANYHLYGTNRPSTASTGAVFLNFN